MAAVPNAIMANNDVQMVQMTASEPSASAAASATSDVTSNATSNTTNNATSGGLTLRRGMKLRCYIPACGWIENNGKKLILFVIAIKNMVDARIAEKTHTVKEKAERVRVTAESV